MGLLSNLFGSEKDYSALSDEELAEKREELRLEFVAADSAEESDRLYNLLNDVDNEQGRRDWDGEEYGYPAHSEHGWYLPNDD